MQHINIKFMAKNDTSSTFYFHKPHKSWSRVKLHQVPHQAYTQDPNLCVVKILNECISR